MSESVQVEALMAASGVKFGTSGARGLVVQMTDRVCVAYTLAFLQHLASVSLVTRDTPVVVAGDLRPSTPRISQAVAFAARHLGHPVEFAGWVPSPALALRGLDLKAAAIMVTGSHIPDDRNGIKFNTPLGEVTKADEAGVRRQTVVLPDVFDEDGMLTGAFAEPLPPPSPAALLAYKRRFLSAFPKGCLEGMSLGVYGHSAVGRDVLVELYEELGARVTRLGYSDKFIPVDTEAIRDEDADLARKWAKDQSLDSIVSTDGDSDRPLISDEQGRFIRGDVAGIMAARFLGADAIATPVSCNTAAEKSKLFERVVRTRIGSPFVIEGMQAAASAGSKRVVGYEANGGFLTFSDFVIEGGGQLPALPTRDAVIVHLTLLLSARAANKPLSALFEELPPRFTASDRDPDFSQSRSEKLLAALDSLDNQGKAAAFALGPLTSVDKTDGLRIVFASEDIVHLRPSGNAPELRCYAESGSESEASRLVALGLTVARRLAPAI